MVLSHLQVSKVLSDNVLPTLCISYANRALSQDVWDVLELMPFADRAEVCRGGLILRGGLVLMLHVGLSLDAYVFGLDCGICTTGAVSQDVYYTSSWAHAFC